jgi:hypothetical protein
MIIDPMAGLALPPICDIKVEKKSEAEQPRPIVESDKSDDSKLDLQRQNVARRKTSKSRHQKAESWGKRYNSSGGVEEDIPPKNARNGEGGRIKIEI